MFKEKFGQKCDFLNSSSSEDSEARALSAEAAGGLVEEKAGKTVIKNYLSETRWLTSCLKKNPKIAERVLRVLSITKDNSLILNFPPIYKLYRATEELYKNLCDGRTVFSENVVKLLAAVADKIDACCVLIENEDYDALAEVDVKPYLVYLDKALVGEIFDVKKLSGGKKDGGGMRERSEPSYKPQKDADSLLTLKSSQIAQLVNQHEEMIARTYILMNQVEILKNSIYENDMKAAKNSYKQLASDSQNLQNNLLISHDQLMSFMQDDAFLARHQDFQGFFVLANGMKYLIPAEFVIDVISESSLNYVEKENQKYVVYIQESESGSEKNREEIPIYSLSSILPGTPASERPVMDTIILAQYQGQKLGIIVDSMLKFVSLIKKPMPPAFEKFKVLKGVAFDEKYDMIPILYTPEIMKKFLSMRGYDSKKFEATTKKRVPRILIVDDSETTRLVEHSIVESNGYLVEEAYDGIDALAKIKDKQFDLVICDDDMPRMGGQILVDNIKRMENYANVPIIALSAKPIDKADAFMGKAGFKRDNLIQKIKELLHE